MRRIVLAVMSTVAAVVVLFGYRTSTAHPAVTSTATVATGSGGTGSTAGAGAATTPAAPTPAPTATSTATSTPAVTSAPTTSAATATAATSAPTVTATTTTTVTGQTEQTRWGPVQVQLTVTGGKVTAVTALQLPSGNGRDQEINDQAVPILVQETLAAQSAQIDSVSGATYTSQGYIGSLQSALDQAGL